MSQTNDRRSAHARALLFMLLALIGVGGVSAQTTSPEDEYKKLVKVDEEIKPLGDTPFGESVNVFDGSLSFHVVDISIPGNGPTIEIGRTFQADGDSDVRMDNESFGDWDIELPRFSTMTSNVGTGLGGPPNFGWVVDTSTRTNRCTSFREPPDLQIGPIKPGNDPTPPSAWWNGGYLLRIPGVPDQTILTAAGTTALMPQIAGQTFTGLSKGNWRMACLPSTANGEPGEAFLAFGPDGSKYWLNNLVYRPARGYKILRRMGYMYATRMEDRFGNWLTYSYDQTTGRINSIDANDGRHVAFAYTADGKYIASVSVVTAASTRTWSYGYSPTASGVTLTSVRLPDGSQWSYNLSSLTYNVPSTPKPGDCLDVQEPTDTQVRTGYATAPSGLQGQFDAKPTRHARSGVYSACETAPAGVPRYWARPRYTNNLALIQKTLTGAGMSGMSWKYSYPLATATFTSDCPAGSSCDYTSHADISDPEGKLTRYTFSNRADVTEGKPLRTDYFDDAAGTSLIRSDVFEYADPARGPWPARFGGSFDTNANFDRLEKEAPVIAKHIYVDGGSYNWQALDYDALARPTSVHRENSAGSKVDERTTYLDDAIHWVVGLPLQADNLSMGETVSRYVYDPNTLTLSERYHFGRKVMGYTFNAAGQIETFTDANGQTTRLYTYYRGIPTDIRYPDGTTQALSVDDMAQVRSIRNQAGDTTTYSYDAIGRVAGISYPSNDTVAWNGKTFTYEYIGSAERDIGANHWRRTMRQGDRVQTTYFDALLRPLISDAYRGSDGSLRTSNRTDYNSKGQKTFVSYPYAGAPGLASMGAGIATAYDVTGRPTSSTQNSEQGDLTTTTTYLAAAGKVVKDPNGALTTIYYQSFDEPSYDGPLRVEAPEGVVQDITRDVYGNPTSISQGGTSKNMVYDSEHRLCRTSEPESGSEIMAYDPANNLAWSASGLPKDMTNCGYDQVPDAAKTTRSYDAMNRVKTVAYPGGSLATTFSYDALGNTSSAISSTSTSSGNNTGNVQWAYGRNKLGLLTAEIMSIDSWSWRLDYGYDGNGNLSTVQYPDGEVVPYNPNALGQPTTVGSYAGGVTYFPDGDVQSYTLGSGSLYYAEKNDRKLLANFTYGKGGSPSISEDFLYDLNGNVQHIVDQTGGHRSKDMWYDGLNRLTRADSNGLWGSELYHYDARNNITSVGDLASPYRSAYTYDGNNLLSSITTDGAVAHSFQYDTRGNTVNKDGQGLTFDFGNRLVAMPGKGEYMYDALGRRAKKVTPAGTTYYTYNSAGQLMWEVDAGTHVGTDYIYLGRKLVAKSSDSIDKLLPRDVNASLSIVGVPHLSADGSTIDVTVDIANNGTRTLTSSTNYPVHLGNHIVDGAGTVVQFDVDRFGIPDVAPGAHASATIHMASAAVLGNGRRFRIDLVQEGVSWFQSWGTTPLEIGPYSACPAAGTGNLCNNESGLTRAQVSATLTYISPPTLLADGQTVSATIDIANNGTVTLAPGGTHPVNMGYYLVESSGSTTGGSLRASIPEIAPGTHAAVTIAFPSAEVIGNGRTIRYVPVQETISWLDGMGITALISGPYARMNGPLTSTDGALSFTWTSMPGAKTYNFRESLNGGAWTIVSSSAATSWSGFGRVTGTYTYQVQACATGCSTWSPSYTTQVLLPPPAPSSIAASAPVAGPISVSWAASSTASYYALEYQFNNGGFAAVGNIGGNSWTGAASQSGTYNYRVRACNASGCSGYATSNAVGITLPPASAPGIAGGGTSNSGAYTIAWNGVGDASAYNLVESANGGGWQQVQYSASGSWSTSGRGNGSYVYQVQACNAGGCGPWSGQAVVNVALIPPTPPRPQTSLGGSGTKITIKATWSAVAYATSYELQLKKGTGPFATVSGGTAMTWSSLEPAGSYQLQLRACNAVGCSAWSAIAGVTI
jgi:YD repeat-containing protein